MQLQTIHVSNANVWSLEQPHRKATAGSFRAYVRAWCCYDVELQLRAQRQQMLNVTVAIKMINIWSR